MNLILREREKGIIKLDRILKNVVFLRAAFFQLSVLFCLLTVFSGVLGTGDEAWGFQRPKVLSFNSVDGLSVIKNNNIEKALNSAVSSALKSAIYDFAESLGELTFNQVWLLELLIDDNYKRYVHGYRILKSGISDQFYVVNMSIDLFIDAIKTDLIEWEIATPVERPKILVLIDEKLSPIYSEENFLTLFSVVEDTILKRLKDDGWDAVGRNAVMEIANLINVRDAFSSEVFDSVSVAAPLKASYMLVGTVEKTTEVESSKPLIEFSYRIISVEEETVEEEEQIVGISNADDSFLARTQALRAAAKSVGDDFVEFLQEEFSVEQEEPVLPDLEETPASGVEKSAEGIETPPLEYEEPPLPDMNTL